MDFQIRGTDLHISDRIRETASKRGERLDRYFNGNVSAKLELRHLGQRTGPGTVVAQCTIHAGQSILRAEERDADAEKAVELAIDKMERQARRFHDRNAHHGRRKSVVESNGAVVDEGTDEEAASVLKVKQFPVKPMDQDEAIEQMELLGHDFFLFQNRETGGVSLIYRRKDGALGMLVPVPM